MNLQNNPLVTIVTVSYNVVSTIERTILSVVNQTYSNIEYIIIDGGSTDGTVDIIKKYMDKIAYWVSEPDKGIYDAMNKGILMAKGQWINFMKRQYMQIIFIVMMS
jgi:glycosyltransferase involved in cell wall biosynthesis